MMKKREKLLPVLFLMAALLTNSVCFAEGEREWKKASDFTLKSLTGKNIKLSELRGRVVLINFWATWCAPCKEELPLFNRLYGKYRSLGLEILGVNIDKAVSQASQMSGMFNLTFPVLLDTDGRVAELYRIRSMPTTFVVAKDGTVRHIHWGFGPTDATRYEAEIRSLLKE
jgi:peroxiredoxin